MSTTSAAPASAYRGGLTWCGTELTEPVWHAPFPREVVDEVDRFLSTNESPSDRDDDAARALWLASHDFLESVRERLLVGPGVAVTSGLPFAEWGMSRSQRAIEALAPLLGPLMEQTYTGTLFYDVRDTGVTYRPGVRRSLTNAPQPFHTDGPWTAATPEHIALFCLQPSAGGGVNRCISIFSLLDELAVQDAELYRRLGEALPWHRQGEHERSAPPVSHHPLWWRDVDGQRWARLYTDYVHSGARLEGTKLDAPAVEALDALEELAIQPHRWLEFTLAKGDVLWINNRACAHSRTGFDSKGIARHLVRVWFRHGNSSRLDA